METRRRAAVARVLLIVGGLVLAAHLVPGLVPWFDRARHWPLAVVALGLLALVPGLLAWRVLRMPGLVTLATGLILLYQNASNDWDSWAYLWALYPMVVGGGLLLFGAVDGRLQQVLRRAGYWLILGAVLLLAAKALAHRLDSVGDLWPVLVLLGGLWGIFQPRSGAESPERG